MTISVVPIVTTPAPLRPSDQPEMEPARNQSCSDASEDIHTSLPTDVVGVPVSSSRRAPMPEPTVTSAPCERGAGGRLMPDDMNDTPSYDTKHRLSMPLSVSPPIITIFPLITVAAAPDRPCGS